MPLLSDDDAMSVHRTHKLATPFNTSLKEDEYNYLSSRVPLPLPPSSHFNYPNVLSSSNQILNKSNVLKDIDSMFCDLNKQLDAMLDRKNCH
jgi:hypothetical protein